MAVAVATTVPSGSRNSPRVVAERSSRVTTSRTRQHSQSFRIDLEPFCAEPGRRISKRSLEHPDQIFLANRLQPKHFGA